MLSHPEPTKCSSTWKQITYPLVYLQPSLRYTLEKKKYIFLKRCDAETLQIIVLTLNTSIDLYSPGTVHAETIILFISPCVLGWKTLFPLQSSKFWVLDE